MPVVVMVVLMLSVVFCVQVGAQVVVVNGIELPDAQTNLSLTIEVLEVREGTGPDLHLTTGKKHYGVSIVSSTPIRMFDVEFPLEHATPHHFRVKVEDEREFNRCLVTGVKSSGTDPSHHLVYALT